MNFSWNAVKAGVGLFVSFGISLGLLMYLLISSEDGDSLESEFVFILTMFGFMVSMILSPVLATIVGAIIAKDFDDESDAAFNGAIAGVAGTLLMAIIAAAFMFFAMDNLVEDNSSDDGDGENDSSSDTDYGELVGYVIKGLLPSAAGGAIGAFAGFRFLWAKMPSSEMMSANLPPQNPPQY